MKRFLLIVVFAILGVGLIFPSPSITVNKPDGTVAWFKGNTYQIKWTPSGCQETDYKINIFKGSVDTE
ncbi:MAG: hypothetical protein ABFR36_03585, partial [Acidobacteriota bacterium]